MLTKNGQVALTAIMIALLLLTAIISLNVYKLPPQFPIIFFLAAIIFIIAFIKTDIALIILIFSMLLSPEFKLAAIKSRAVVVRADDIFLFVVFFGWLAKMAVNKELGLIRQTHLNRPILVYIFICFLATFLGALQGYVNIKEGIFYLLKYIEYFILFFMVVNNIRDVQQVKRFIFFILLTCFLVGGYAWWKYFGGGIRVVTAPFEGKGEPNTLAGYLLLMMGIIIGLLLHLRSNLQKIVLLGLLGFIIPPFLFTLSRGAWLGFFPMYITLIIMVKKYRKLLTVSLIIILVLSPFILPQVVRQRITSTFIPGKVYMIGGKALAFDESSAGRIDVWREIIEKWRKRPVLGYGIPGVGTLVDSQYAKILGEVGFIGFMCFSWLMAMIFRAAWQTSKVVSQDKFAQGLSLGFIAGFIGLLFQGTAAETFIIVRIMEPFWFLVAVVVMLPYIAEKKPPGMPIEAT